ncbi:MAG TPA: hypothetical protein VHY20_06270, partial [Pirellulales bacterium]|nr:hypothetical protein [Pirellulales bacterium]
MSDAVVILGASARAAAFSALRAGLTPWCADCFADEDLAARCVALPAENWPDDLFPLAAGFPPGPWLYTGGLENYPEFVEQLAAGRLLCGNRGAALAAARDPFTVQRVLAAAGLAGPRCERDVERLDPQLRWLCKSRRSAGGLRVRPWPTSDSRHEPDDYFQQFVPGLACAAAYVAAAGDAVFLGMTEQLLWGAP